MKRVLRLSIAALLSVVLSVNLLAYMQARAMTRFTATGERVGRPEQLSVIDKFSVLLSGVSIPRPANRGTPADFGMIFETQRFSTPSGATLEAWFLPTERDRPIVALFHGYAASKSRLLTAAKAFHQYGYPTLLVDFYGSGGSSGSGTTIGFKEAEDVAAAVNHLRQSWPGRKIILYGFSMGGAAVLRAVAMLDVKIDGLIVEATFDRLLNTGRNRFQAMGLPVSPFAELVMFWGGLQNGFNAFAHDPAEYARFVKLPTLILHGAIDQRATVDQARNIASAMGVHARLIVYEEVSHRPIVEARREDWNRDVVEFLQSIR